jgi:CheY-like chemotaxis protein
VTAKNGKKRIVVADDSKFWREKIATVIAREGHEVIAVENGVSAIRLCMNAAQPVDMLVVDLIMPGVDGFEVARYLRAEHASERIPIMAVTGLFKSDDFPEGPQSQGFEEIVEKSCTPDQFLSIFNKALTRETASRRPAPRVVTELPAEYRCADGRTGRCVVANLSATGAYLSTNAPLRPGTELTVAFGLPEGPAIRTPALVIWVRETSAARSGEPPRGMGVLFRRMQLGLQTALERYVKDRLSEN